ncbi:hypothetical protein K1X76_11495 [bacterium]|nr:hypothetical protein [bacterium]
MNTLEQIKKYGHFLILAAILVVIGFTLYQNLQIIHGSAWVFENRYHNWTYKTFLYSTYLVRALLVLLILTFFIRTRYFPLLFIVTMMGVIINDIFLVSVAHQEMQKMGVMASDLMATFGISLYKPIITKAFIYALCFLSMHKLKKVKSFFVAM